MSLFALCIGLSMCGVGTVRAAPPDTVPPNEQGEIVVEGHVVAVQDEDIIVDLAGLAGAKGGDELELWRPIVLKHPVTRKRVRDRFHIGLLSLVQVRDKLAIANSLDVARMPKEGDVVILRRTKPAASEVSEDVEPDDESVEPPRVPLVECEETSPEARHVAIMFESLQGASLRKRVTAYESYVQQHPKSPYTRTLREEANMLRRLYELAKKKGVVKVDQPLELRSFKEPHVAREGSPLRLAVEIRGKARSALLHTRRAGDTRYASWKMKTTGAGYFSATLTAKAMRAGKLEYFIEAIDRDGTTHPLVGSSSLPRSLEVEDKPTPDPLDPYIATLAVWTDYADYNRLKGNDFAWQTEGYFGMRFGDTGIRAVRTGFGVFRGLGGTLEDLDEHSFSARRIGLTYGYIETEFGFHHFVGLSVRGVVGLEANGVTGGAQAMLRLGNDLETNLQLGGEILGGVGLRGIAQLELNIFEDWPMMVRTEVTNQPAGATATTNDVRPADNAPIETTSLGKNDVGGRAIAQVGYRIFDPLVVAIRGSYQGRTIKHSGPGLGGAVSYTW